MLTESGKCRFANIRQVMMKRRRGVKCPVLNRFISLTIDKDQGSFVVMEDIFTEYTTAVVLWTEGDSIHRQTKYLMKKRSYYEASAKITQNYIHIFFKTPGKVKKIHTGLIEQLSLQTSKLATYRDECERQIYTEIQSHVYSKI